MSYQTNNQEIKEMRSYSYVERSRMARKKKREEFISNVIGGFFAMLFMVGFFLMFLFAWVEEDKNWNPPVANTEYVNEYETPDVSPWTRPEV